MQNSAEPLARGLPAPLYAIVFLPIGLVSGFITVTLSYVLGRRGVSVAVVSGLVGLYLLPTAWMFLAAPVVDVSLSPRRWYLISAGALAGCFVAFAATPMTAAAVPILGALCFAASASTVGVCAAGAAAMTLTTTPRQRGPIAGWFQTANLGGTGLGGGLALWMVGHAGGPVAAALAMAALSLAGLGPLGLMRVPPRSPGATLPQRIAAMGREVVALARTRKGVLAVVVMGMPAALGATAQLLPAAAGQWRASGDLVALVFGALGGLFTIPGCILGGYLCRRFRNRAVYIWAALAYAASLTAMVVAPHTPMSFAVFVILNAVILGVALGALMAVNYDCLGPSCAATINAVLVSLSIVPTLLVTLLLGLAEARFGADGMLLTEAGLGAVSVAGYAVLTWLWRESPAPFAPKFGAAA